MRLLHTSDWHLGKKLNNFDRLEEQRDVMREIVSIADEQNVDMVVVAGDLFDTFNPSSDAQQLLYQTLYELSHDGQRPVIAIAGNHDSPDRVESPEVLAQVSGIFMFGYPNSMPGNAYIHKKFNITKTDQGFMEIQIPGCMAPIRILHTPFTNQERLQAYLGVTEDEEQKALRNQLQNMWQKVADKYCDNAGVNILIAHQFVINNENDTDVKEPDDENAVNVGGTSAIFSYNIPRQIQYTALGHLHQCRKVGDNNIWYSGSPLEYSFAETNQDKFVLVSDIEPNKEPSVNKILLESGCKLKRMTFNNILDATNWLEKNKDCWVELTIVSDNYLSHSDKQMLYDASNKIVAIIPQVNTTSDTLSAGSLISSIRTNKTALFMSYFTKMKGGEPDQSLIDLFKEIISQQ
ncbi:MAG: exonuclease subunit SbcD [Bacteroidales bacterium]|nr:exonuclease subunit SbcD [Bacteroidales bacterium]